MAEQLGSQEDIFENKMRRKPHVKGQRRIIRAREQPRQRLGGGKEPEIVKNKKESLVPALKEKRVMSDTIRGWLEARRHGTSQASLLGIGGPRKV